MTSPVLQGRRALVTGSVSGLGLAIASKLAEEGADVILHGLVSPREGQEKASQLSERTGRRVIFDGTDLADPSAIERMVERIRADFGDPNILVNNAVIRHFHAIEDFPRIDWERALAVNVNAAFHLIRLTLSAMKAKGWGRIVNLSSIYGNRGAAERIDYVTSKTALLGITRAVAIETAETGVTCNAVSPGSVLSEPIARKIAGIAQREGIDEAEARRAYIRERHPTARFVETENVGALIAFLCGPHSADITGATLPMDGGWHVA
ncbi:SDR family oxidoreductase [Chelativorans sp. M5D2P16]|uniref:SDR family oxidoreductase n=1 Tax=Chelativorans sp. M5D2P16 TaxID=3095678 RepID=UPI002ACA17CF|nr:SDR family oxidoreductase [Chelativorans sp. M5D2P16]MDZ5696612.1 SDR family oxidoreductase [Chelativorans sp. M5D2P16]